MTRDTAAETHIPTRRVRQDLVGPASLTTAGVVILSGIAGLVWATVTFFNWLVS